MCSGRSHPYHQTTHARPTPLPTTHPLGYLGMHTVAYAVTARPRCRCRCLASWRCRRCWPRCLVGSTGLLAGRAAIVKAIIFAAGHGEYDRRLFLHPESQARLRRMCHAAPLPLRRGPLPSSPISRPSPCAPSHTDGSLEMGNQASWQGPSSSWRRIASSDTNPSPPAHGWVMVPTYPDSHEAPLLPPAVILRRASAKRP